MKTVVIWKSLSLCAIGLMFLANSPLAENQTTVAQAASTVFTMVDGTTATTTIHTVTIKGMVFDPAELHVKKGDAVMWINKDIVAHNVTEFPYSKWTSGTLPNGKSWKKSIDKSFDYFCSIHPTMKGKIIVDK